jgi:putative chitinase
MNTDDARRLQARLGVRPDGLVGRNTYRALFGRLGAAPSRAGELALGANVHLPRYEIDANPKRMAHFLAQVCHESGGFRYMEEIASGAAYDGRKDLGNVFPGDGKRFKGRGPIQLTGRANYRRFGQLCGIDLENHPEIAAMPSVGMLTAALYWDDRKLNALADAGDIEGITRKINGGLNGFADRKEWFAKVWELVR